MARVRCVHACVPSACSRLHARATVSRPLTQHLLTCVRPGYYRPTWIAYKSAVTAVSDPALAGTDVCRACGQGILSEPAERDQIPDNSLAMSLGPAPGLVPATTTSCCEFFSPPAVTAAGVCCI